MATTGAEDINNANSSNKTNPGSTSSKDGLDYSVETDNYVVTRYLYYNSEETYNNKFRNNLDMDTFRYVFGAPYQFLPSVDPRLLNDTDTDMNSVHDKNKRFGRKYYDKIITKMPLLLMSPGSPKFMPQISDKNKRAKAIDIFVQAFNSIGGSNEKANNALDVLLQDYTGKAYYIDLDYEEYYKYVNPMCRAGAHFLGIQDEKVFNNVPFGLMGWHANTNTSSVDYMKAKLDDKGNVINGDMRNTASLNSVQNFLYYKRCVPFYVESETQITENFTNDTTESSLAGKINPISDTARELGFILGRGFSEIGVDYENISSGFQDKIDELTNMFKSKDGKVNNILGNMSELVETITRGGRVIFPEIWSDSKFSRSYSINIKLATPDNDPISWYLNIFVPLCHLMGFVLPRQATRLGYSAPFLVRAFYQGFFNVDMGIITNMTFTKGKESGWTRSGLPTVVDVNFDIKDLYQELAMTSNDNIKYNMMSNTSEMDYIANMCGVNINAPDMERFISMYFAMNTVNKFQDFIELDIVSRAQSLVGNIINKSWNNIIGRFN